MLKFSKDESKAIVGLAHYACQDTSIVGMIHGGKGISEATEDLEMSIQNKLLDADNLIAKGAILVVVEESEVR